MYIREMECCGCGEIHDLQKLCLTTELEFLHDVYNQMIWEFDRELTFLVFTGADRKRRTSEYVTRWIRFIERHRFGNITGFSSARNTNTGNHITAHLWKPNWPSIRRYLISHKKKLAVPFGQEEEV